MPDKNDDVLQPIDAVIQVAQDALQPVEIRTLHCQLAIAMALREIVALQVAPTA